MLDTLIFNDIIGHLGLVELPLKGQAFTWSNMQQDPLLEQLDWFLHMLTGLSPTPIPWFYPWLKSPQIIFHVRW